MKIKQNKTEYVCQQCGSVYQQWKGQCSDCHAWNSLTESVITDTGNKLHLMQSKDTQPKAEIISLSQISLDQINRIGTSLTELDRVLGGGLVPGSVVLIGGDPGIGKSTLMLQAAHNISTRCNGSKSRKVLYVCGEESPKQVAARSARLGLDASGLSVLAETQLEKILDQASAYQPELMIVDSLQTIFSSSINAAPASVSQMRDCTAHLTRFAKQNNIALFVVGHVTKEGSIAGPKVVEHIVDAVLYFESESNQRFRMIRSIKNRFGAVNELGVFIMAEDGLKEVASPSAIFLAREHVSTPGSIVTIAREGTRPILVELQALVDDSGANFSRRLAMGIDGQRLNMLLAILHKHAGIAIHGLDIFVNLVGGVRLQEPATDLSVLLAIVSSLKSRPFDLKTATFGEIGLGGEVRPVPNGEERVRAAAQHGFKRILLPASNRVPNAPKQVELIAVKSLQQALDLAWE